ncbi:MAG: hypothetical protein LBL80_04680 [Ruminococcus sp.]|nr:hypothetical protein [Ruminococcus sp.]
MKIYLDNCCYNRPFDYTSWRENLWDDITPDELFQNARLTAQKYFIPNGVKQI